MNIFTLNLIMLGFWSLAFRKHLDPLASSSKASLFYVIIISLQLFSIVLLSPVVSDASVYAQYAEAHYYGNLEIGWRVLSEVSWFVWPNSKSPMLFTSSVLLISFAVFTIKHSRNLALSYLIFICLGFWGASFYILRQTAALAILLFSYSFIEKRRPLHFVVSVLLATSFHQSAALFILLYPICKVKRSGLYHVVTVYIGLLFLLVGDQIVSFVSSQFGRITYELTELSGVSLLILFIGCLLFVEFFNKKSVDSPFRHAMELSCVLQTLALHLSVFTRMTWPFSISLTILMPGSFRAIEDKSTRMLSELAFVVFLVFFYLVIQDTGFPGGSDAYYIDPPLN